MAQAKSAERKPRKARERRRDKDVRPQQIVAAAFEEFAEKGFAGTRLEDVAARAKVSKGLPYLYFKTKVELFKAVIRSVITSHFDVIREQMETTELSASRTSSKVRSSPSSRSFVGSRRAFIVRLLIAEGHKHPELTAVLLRERRLARHRDDAAASSIAASRAASSARRACATFRSFSSRRC